VIASIHDKRETFRKTLQPEGGAAYKRQALKSALKMPR